MANIPDELIDRVDAQQQFERERNEAIRVISAATGRGWREVKNKIRRFEPSEKPAPHRADPYEPEDDGGDLD